MSDQLPNGQAVSAVADRARTWVTAYAAGHYTEVVRDWQSMPPAQSIGVWSDLAVVEAVACSLALTKSWAACERFRAEVATHEAAAAWLGTLDAWCAVHDSRYDSAIHTSRNLRAQAAAAGSAVRVFAHSLKVEGVALFRTGRYTEAEALTRRALDLFAIDDNDPLQAAHCATNLGLILNAAGDLQGARKELAKACLALLEHGAADERVALAQANLAIVDTHLGKLDDAQFLFQQALATFERLGLRSERITALNGLGHCARALGHTEAALAHHRAALTLALGTDHLARQVGLCHEFIGRVLFERGDRPAAETHYLQAFEIAANIAPEGDLMLEICWHLADLRVANGELDRADELLSRAEELCKSSGGGGRELGCVQRARASWHAARGEHDIAAELFASALATFGHSGRRLEAILTRVAAAKAALEAGERSRGIDGLQRAREALVNDFPGSMWIDRVESLLELHDERADRAAPPPTRYGFVTRDPELVALLDDLPSIAGTQHPVLIHGESGTGKELLARAVHALAERKGACIAVNCAAIPRDLFESELFGHVRGSFSGAQGDKPGLFEQADGGTLILDEIGEMPIEMQAKLLRVLDDGVVRRVGSVKQLHVNVKIVSATNRALESAIAAGLFRADLYHRLAVHSISVKPLRERPGDIQLLAEHFLHLESLTERLQLDGDAIAELRALPWTGNARELRNHLVRAALQRRPDPAATIARSKALRVTRSTHERRAIEHALSAAGGSVAEAARTLRLHTTTLRRKMRSLGIERRA